MTRGTPHIEPDSGHTTHYNDCGCATARNARDLAAANAAILALQKTIERARKALENHCITDAQRRGRALDILNGKDVNRG